jgi:hypothetical protein
METRVQRLYSRPREEPRDLGLDPGVDASAAHRDEPAAQSHAAVERRGACPLCSVVLDARPRDVGTTERARRARTEWPADYRTTVDPGASR